MIVYNNNFIKMLKTMHDVYKMGINLTAIGYSSIDTQGEMICFKIFLAQNVLDYNKKCSYKINHVSGYEQSTINLFRASDLFDEFTFIESEVECKLKEDLYGEDFCENNNYDDDKCSINMTHEQFENLVYDNIAQNVQDRIYKNLIEKIKEENLERSVFVVCNLKNEDILKITIEE